MEYYMPAQGYGLATYDGTSWSFQRDSTNQIISVNSNFCSVGDSVFFGATVQNNYPSHYALVHYKSGVFHSLTNQTTGLASSSINGLAFDRQNRLWMATRSNTLRSNDIRHVFLDSFDGQHYREFDTTMVRKMGVQMQGETGNNLVFDSKGNLWIGLYDGGVMKYDGTHFTLFDTTNSNLPSDCIQALVIDHNDNVWVGTKPNNFYHKTGGLAEYNGKTWAVYDTSNSGLMSNNVDAIAVDKNNNIWVGILDSQLNANDGGLVKFDGINWTVQISFQSNHTDFPSHQIYSIAVDKNNEIYAGTRFQLLYLFDGTNWSNIPVPVMPNSSASNMSNVTSLYVDSNNSLWALAGPILGAYNGSQWVEYTTQNSPLTSGFGQGNSIIEGPNGYIWASSGSGLYKFKDDPTIFTAIQKDVPGSHLPQKVKLDQNYPNPFNPSTNIAFDLPRAMNVRLLIYNVLGRVVAELSGNRMSAGKHEFVWNASNNASGIYFYRLITANGTTTKKMILLK